MTTSPSDRDPRVDPRAGDVLRHHLFGAAGADFRVTRVGPGRRGRESVLVSCDVRALDGHRLERRGRVYGLSGWPDFMREATVVSRAPEVPRVE